MILERALIRELCNTVQCNCNCDPERERAARGKEGETGCRGAREKEDRLPFNERQQQQQQWSCQKEHDN